LTTVDADTLTKAARSDLADSALHAPQAGFGDVEFYPDIYDKAAVLLCQLAPLPDGNKRAAWTALVMFIDLNHGAWDPDPPDIDEAEQAMLAIAGRRCGRGLDCGVAERTRPVRGLRLIRKADAALHKDGSPASEGAASVLGWKPLPHKDFEQRARGDSNTQPPDP
jgi:death-on-curing protein